MKFTRLLLTLVIGLSVNAFADDGLYCDYGRVVGFSCFSEFAGPGVGSNIVFGLNENQSCRNGRLAMDFRIVDGQLGIDAAASINVNYASSRSQLGEDEGNASIQLPTSARMQMAEGVIDITINSQPTRNYGGSTSTVRMGHFIRKNAQGAQVEAGSMVCVVN